MTEEGKTYIRYSDKNSLMPKEETLERKPEKKQFIIGIPREADPNESRVPLAPMAVGVLIKNGHRVLVGRVHGSGRTRRPLTGCP